MDWQCNSYVVFVLVCTVAEVEALLMHLFTSPEIVFQLSVHLAAHDGGPQMVGQPVSAAPEMR